MMSKSDDYGHVEIKKPNMHRLVNGLYSAHLHPEILSNESA